MLAHPPRDLLDRQALAQPVLQFPPVHDDTNNRCYYPTQAAGACTLTAANTLATFSTAYPNDTTPLVLSTTGLSSGIAFQFKDGFNVTPDLVNAARPVHIDPSIGINGSPSFKSGEAGKPGYFYDFDREGLLVLSLLTPESTFQEGVRRLAEYIEMAADERR